MVKICWRSLFIALLLVANAAAQTTFDLSGGMGGVEANWGSWVHAGGLWTTVNGTAMLTEHLGISADFSAHAVGRVYGDRPYLADINLALRAAPAQVTPELDLGWGGARIPTGGSCAAFAIVPCSYAGSHFRNGAHIGLALPIHLADHWFLRPAYHLYVGKNMGHPNFFAVSFGYSFGGR